MTTLATWTLILWFLGSGAAAIHDVPGFLSKDSCEAAFAAIAADNKGDMWRPHHACAEQ